MSNEVECSACPECGAAVPRGFAEFHTRWHAKLTTETTVNTKVLGRLWTKSSVSRSGQQ